MATATFQQGVVRGRRAGSLMALLRFEDDLENGMTYLRLTVVSSSLHLTGEKAVPVLISTRL
jgi:hypothetical protein